MAIIYSYPSAQVELSDLIIGTKTTERGKATKSFLVSDLVYLINTAVSPTLQQVTDNGNVSDNGLIVDDGEGNIVEVKTGVVNVISDDGVDAITTSVTPGQISFSSGVSDNACAVSTSGIKIVNHLGRSVDIVAGSAITANRTYTFPNASGALALQSAASNTFTSNDGKTITVVNGIITSIV